MKRVILKSVSVRILYVLGVLLVSCSKDSELTIGKDFIKSTASLVYSDTMSLELSTLILDSIPTAGKKVALVGKYIDNNIGIVESMSYIHLGANTYSIDEESVYDSLVLVLTSTGYYYGDTLANYNLNVYRVSETIEVKDNAGYLSNRSQFGVYPNTIGKKTINAKPLTNKEIRIPLDRQLGLEFTNKFRSSSNSFIDESFTSYFKGIKLQVDGETNSILGFLIADTLAVLKLYYHIEGTENVDSVDIKSYNTSRQFNEIKLDETNLLLKKLSQEPLLSKSLDNNSYVQGGAGIVTRIDFPTLKNLQFQNRKFEIINATLVIQPSLEMNLAYLPSKLSLFATNKHNDFIAQLADENGDAITGSLYQDNVYKENTCYSWNITSFLNHLINNQEDQYNGLLVLPENYDREFNHVVIADQQKSEYRTKLKLLILYYE